MVIKLPPLAFVSPLLLVLIRPSGINSRALDEAALCCFDVPNAVVVLSVATQTLGWHRDPGTSSVTSPPGKVVLGHPLPGHSMGEMQGWKEMQLCVHTGRQA